MDAGIAAIVAAIINTLGSTLSAIVVARINARSQSEARHTLDGDVTDLFEVEAAKPSVLLRLLRAIARLLIVFLYVLGVLALAFILLAISGRYRYSAIDDLGKLLGSRHLSHLDSPGWAIWVILFSGFLAPIVGAVSQYRLDRMASPQSN
jgi:hypothetical protein